MKSRKTGADLPILPAVYDTDMSQVWQEKNTRGTLFIACMSPSSKQMHVAKAKDGDYLMFIECRDLPARATRKRVRFLTEIMARQVLERRLE